MMLDEGQRELVQFRYEDQRITLEKKTECEEPEGKRKMMQIIPVLSINGQYFYL